MESHSTESGPKSMDGMSSTHSLMPVSSRREEATPLLSSSTEFIERELHLARDVVNTRSQGSTRLLELSRNFKYTPGKSQSHIRDSTPITDWSRHQDAFESTWKDTLKQGTQRNFSSHLNNYIAFMERRNLQPFPVQLVTLTQYFYYYIVVKRHVLDDDLKGYKHYHSVRSLRQPHSAIKNYASAIGQFFLDAVEQKALTQYYNKTLAKLYPPDPDKQFPIRLCLLVQAWEKRRSKSSNSFEDIWFRDRDFTSQITAHQGMLRNREVTSLHGKDVRFNTLNGSVSSVTITIQGAKSSNPHRDAGLQRVHIPSRPDQPDICAVSALSKWSKFIGIVNISLNVV